MAKNMFLLEGKVTKLWPSEKVTNGVMESVDTWNDKSIYSKMEFTIFTPTLERSAPVEEGGQYKFIGSVNKKDWKGEDGKWNEGKAQFTVNSIEPIHLPELDAIKVYSKSNRTSQDSYQDDSEISQEELDSIPF